MNIEACIQRLTRTVQGETCTDESMARHTTWKIGGPADFLVVPKNREDIIRVINACREYAVPWWVMGSGSNLLVLDEGIRGIVIKTAGGLTDCRWQGNRIEAGSGVFLPRLAKEAAERGLCGLEWCAGIPASVGGALVMNAGVGDSSFSDFVQAVHLVDAAGGVQRRSRQELGFAYRGSALQNEQVIVTSVSLELPQGDRKACAEKIKTLLRKRQDSQPLEYPTAGSVFKNPPGDFAGRLLEKAGTKGLQIGAAQVSLKHANFIVNLGGAKAADVVQLIAEMKARVAEKFQIQLETEIRIVGEAE